jgi:hypothetical protein
LCGERPTLLIEDGVSPGRKETLKRLDEVELSLGFAPHQKNTRDAPQDR